MVRWSGLPTSWKYYQVYNGIMEKKLILVIVSFFLFKAAIELLPQEQLKADSYPSNPESDFLATNSPRKVADLP